MDNVKIMIVDDEQLIRAGLAIILASYPEFQVTTTASSGKEAFEKCAQYDLDMVLMDIRMPDSDGIEGTKLIKSEYPQIKILILTTFKDQEYIQAALQYGASGYLLKDSSQDAIYNGIKTVLSGNTVLHADISLMLNAEGNHKEQQIEIKQIQDEYQLNTKEIDIIRHIAAGYSNKEIAQEMFLSEGTIKNSVSTILNKLELRDRTQLAIFAYRNHFMKE